MKEKLMQFPTPLRKQVLLRCTGAGIGTAMLLIILIYGGSWQFYLPCAIVSILCIGSAWLLYDRCAKNRYVVISGPCVEIERTSIRKRIRSIYLQCDDHRVRVVGIKGIRNISNGDHLDLFVADNTPVYEMDGCKVVCSYIALTRASPKEIEAKKEIPIK